MDADPLDRIGLRGLTARCIIGVFDHERLEPREVEIDILLHVDLHEAGKTDDIRHTADYRALRDAVVAAVDKSQYRLIERLAERVAEICLADRRVAAVTVRVAKAGALDTVRAVEVEIVRRRSEGIHISRKRR